MHDGLNIRWRETAPDRALVTMALSELELLHQGGCDAMQCEIIIERVAQRSATMYRARVDLAAGLGRRERGKHVQADALSSEPGRALRGAFSKLKLSMPASAQPQAA